MIESSNESRNADPLKSAVPKHRSSRLTQCSSSLVASGTDLALCDAIQFSLFQQLPSLLLSSLVLDGGLILDVLDLLR
jgi:hypothetical protein